MILAHSNCELVWPEFDLCFAQINNFKVSQLIDEHSRRIVIYRILTLGLVTMVTGAQVLTL